MGAGMAQAIHCGQLQALRFRFSSNGHGNVLRDATLASGILLRKLTPGVCRAWGRACAGKGWSDELRQAGAVT